MMYHTLCNSFVSFSQNVFSVLQTLNPVKKRGKVFFCIKGGIFVDYISFVSWK